MPILPEYRQFNGLHWETGTVRNALDYQGVVAPHTGEPYTEALLMGVSGGAVMGYFSFAYEGIDPMARILTRNTFDPWTTMLSRLGVEQTVKHTASPEKGIANLVGPLDEGLPAIVWADMWGLPYNVLPENDGMWAMFPILVWGYDEAADRVDIADRARIGLSCTIDELAAARGRVKKDKYRVVTLAAPNAGKLPSAVLAGIADCIKLYTEKPPKGSANNFGLAAYRHWAHLLTHDGARKSWQKVFPPGREMAAGLTSGFTDIMVFGKDGQAERDVFADFLDEAAILLNRPALREVAGQFRSSALAWDGLALTLLPDEVGPLAEIRELTLNRHNQFMKYGNAAIPEIQDMDRKIEARMTQMTADFPLTQPETELFRERIAEQVMVIHDLEAAAVASLMEAML